MFGEDCIAICLIISYWNQVSLGVLKSINGLSPGGSNPGRDRWYFWQRSISVVWASLNLPTVHRDPNRGRWYCW